MGSKKGTTHDYNSGPRESPSNKKFGDRRWKQLGAWVRSINATGAKY